MMFGKRRALKKCQSNQTLRAKMEKNQDQHSCQGGATVAGDHMSVWLSQGALTRPGQEHQSVADDVCAVEFAQGAQTNFAGAQK